MGTNRRHVFISHHFADDESVTALTTMLKREGWDIRNSSIRAKQANQDRLERGEVSERVLKRLLRMKISWAQTVVVLIGSKTHNRPWVNYEIEEANRQGKRIVGVFSRGLVNAQVPEALNKYATSIRAWNSDSIMDAIDGTSDNKFEQSDGSASPSTGQETRTVC